MLEKMTKNLTNMMSDNMMQKLLTDEYSENIYVMLTAARKMTLDATIEASLRGQTGKILQRPYGSPNVQSDWSKLFLNPVQLFKKPTNHYEGISTKTIIGKNAKKPLELDIPLMITGMSYGGSLSLEAKVALARAATNAGTATNTGESALIKAERTSAKKLIGQYHRGGWLSKPEDLKQVDAIEVQLGQGAWGGAVTSSMQANEMGHELKEAWGLEENQDSYKPARMPGIETEEDLILLIDKLKSQYDVPVGIKIAASHYLEKELDCICKTKVDYIVIDGSEGGTSSAPPTLEDCVGLPTLFAVARAGNYLRKYQLEDKIDLILAGGLKNPGDFLKAMAFGAKAVYIGSIALVAMIQVQMTKSIPFEPTPQMVLYQGNKSDTFNIDKGVETLSNFLNSCNEEMKLTVSALGKSTIHELNIQDLVCVDPLLAEGLGVEYAGYKHKCSCKE